MATELLYQEGANLYVGDADPSASLHLMLGSAKLPGLEEGTAEWSAGGGIGAVEVGTGKLKPLQFGFKLKGPQPDVLVQFGLGKKRRTNYTVYGVLRDKRTGGVVQGKTILEGRMTKVEGEDYKSGELAGFDHAVTEIFHFEHYVGGRELYYFDYLTSTWRVDGEDQNADVRGALGLT
jgi:hypothetical protein